MHLNGALQNDRDRLVYQTAVKPRHSWRGYKAWTTKLSFVKIPPVLKKDLPLDKREVTPSEIRAAQLGTRPRNPPK
jgi:hypothetical protein